MSTELERTNGGELQREEPKTILQVIAQAAADPRVIMRFNRLVLPEPMSGCWLWIGALNSNGYGSFFVNDFVRRGSYRGIRAGAHHMAYAIHGLSVPDGLQLDHLCRVRSCVNPVHLEPVTQEENMRRGEGGRRGWETQRAKTHCPRGHEYAGDNLYIYPGLKPHRQCRACWKARLGYLRSSK